MIVVPRFGWARKSTATHGEDDHHRLQAQPPVADLVAATGQEVGDEEDHGELGHLRRLDAQLARTRANARHR